MFVARLSRNPAQQALAGTASRSVSAFECLGFGNESSERRPYCRALRFRFLTSACRSIAALFGFGKSSIGLDDRGFGCLPDLLRLDAIAIMYLGITESVQFGGDALAFATRTLEPLPGGGERGLGDMNVRLLRCFGRKCLSQLELGLTHRLGGFGHARFNRAPASLRFGDPRAEKLLVFLQPANRLARIDRELVLALAILRHRGAA